MSADTPVFLSPNFLPLFIEAYKNHHCLWRIKSKEYANKNVKQNAYLELVELCKTVIPDCTVDFVKKKIDLIRGNFRREHKKVSDSKRSGAGTESVHVPKLWYYKLLLFLSDQEVVRQSITSDSPADDSEQAGSDHDDGDELNEHQEDEEEARVLEESQPEVRTMCAPSASPFGRRKRARSETPDTPADYLKQAVKMLQREEDEYDKFAGNVAAKLRKMDGRQSIFSENLINQVLFQGVLGKLQEDSTIYTPPPFLVTPGNSSNSSERSASAPPDHYQEHNAQVNYYLNNL